MLLHQEITQTIIDSFFTSYNRLDYGFPEAIYAAAMQRELAKAGVRVDREVNTNVYYDGIILGRFRLDMIVGRAVVVEIKTVTRLTPESQCQPFNYLRATNLEVALLLNYGPRPEFRRYICTRDRKHGIDLRQGTTAPFLPEPGGD
jgi:GxxExxY protein